MLLEKLHDLRRRIGCFLPVPHDALDLEPVHLLLQIRAKVDVVNPLTRLGVGRQRALRLAIERVHRRIARAQVVDRRGGFVELMRFRRVQLIGLEAVETLVR